MVVFPNAKLNLGLKVLRKRHDGYHDIQTVFYPVPLRDALEAIPSPDGTFRFTSSGNPVPGKAEENLCIRAYDLLRKDFTFSPVHIHLHKVIPTGAGMGGGSSDAAFTIVLLNRLFTLGMDAACMAGYAMRLGSDCAFFIRNTPCVAKGRGEVMKDVRVALKGYKIVVVKPPFSVDTAEAYSLVKPVNVPCDLAEIIEKGPAAWRDLLVNDFEPEIFKKHSLLPEIKDRFYSSGAVYASMSGSGSVVYGIYADLHKEPGDFPPGCFIREFVL